MSNNDKVREAIERAMARIGCPPGDNADADLYHELKAASEALSAPVGEPVAARPVILWFAEQMEAALHRNDHKGGWTEVGRSFISGIEGEVAELRHAVRNDPAHRIIEEAADIANFAMMTADNFGPLIGDRLGTHPPDRDKLVERIGRLIQQANLCEFKDEHGHDLRMNAAYLDIAALLPPPPDTNKP